MKNKRGFEEIHFSDDYRIDCCIQESSSANPHIWFGVHKPEVKIMYKDRHKLSDSFNIDNINKDHKECNECGWCTINLPKEVLIKSHMHLNQAQAKELADISIYFAETGCLKETSN